MNHKDIYRIMESEHRYNLYEIKSMAIDLQFEVEQLENEEEEQSNKSVDYLETLVEIASSLARIISDIEIKCHTQ